MINDTPIFPSSFRMPLKKVFRRAENRDVFCKIKAILISTFASFRILTSIRIGPRSTTRREREREGEERTMVGSYYRIHGIALTSILVRNAIKRVIQVVIVTPRRGAALVFHPRAVHARP